MLQTHPISSALSLIGVMGSLAVLYLLLGGEFIAVAQLIVYAGAIMVLFVFVIMLLNAGTERKAPAQPVGELRRRSAAGRLARHCRSIIVQRVLPRLRRRQLRRLHARQRRRTSARRCFTIYLLPFEVTSVLILIAILGAIVLARKEID